MKHFAGPDFWANYEGLPPSVKETAKRAFALMKQDERHPSLHLKKVAGLWSVRIGLHYRALGKPDPDGVIWFWIGTHAEYDSLIG